LVFVDESGSDRRIDFRKTAWSPHGVAPIPHQTLERGQRWQILPAYTIDGILAFDVYQGTNDSSTFESFLEFKVLPKCNPFPARNSVIVMDCVRHSDRIKRMCADAGVRLVYLPPFTPDFNPVEEFFLELKAFVRRHWRMYVRMTDQSHESFASYLRFCVQEVGHNIERARTHFNNAALDVDNILERSS
jgi:DDE superfamily endonuclease